MPLAVAGAGFFLLRVAGVADRTGDGLLACVTVSDEGIEYVTDEDNGEMWVRALFGEVQGISKADDNVYRPQQNGGNSRRQFHVLATHG